VVSPELMAFGTRVLERTLQKAGYMPETPADAGIAPSPTDMLVDAIADKLLAFVTSADAVVLPLLQAAVTSPVLDSLQARNQRVARALGACECFGEDITCAYCAGRGSSGWKLPDRQEFEALVRPTLRKVSEVRLSARNGHLLSHQH